MKINIFGSKSLLSRLLGKDNEYTADQLFEKANELFNDGNIGDGYVYLQSAAIKGHTEAAFQMGSAIAEEKTFGTMEDAVRYYTIASNNNHAFATTNLAICYQLGRGVAVDHVKAIQLLNKAIKLRDEMASFNLAQTYLLGVGVNQDENKGWTMLEVLASRGNKNAKAYMDDLLQKGYNPPYKGKVENGLSEKQNKHNLAKYAVDNAPECSINDSNILKLYNSAMTGEKSAVDQLMELGGNQMNREAMNALRKLGLIVEDVSNDFKRGTIEYIANACKTYNVEPLYVVCAWTYPEFKYREYRNNDLLYETTSEDDFIELISNELSKCTKNKIVPKFRLREVDNPSSYCVDILIQGVSLSSFYLDIEDGHFKGIYRVYDDTIV